MYSMYSTYCMRDIDAAPCCGVLVAPPLTQHTQRASASRAQRLEGSSAERRNPVSKWCSRIYRSYCTFRTAPSSQYPEADASLATASSPRWEGRGNATVVAQHAAAGLESRRARARGARTRCPGWESFEAGRATARYAASSCAGAKGSLYGFSGSYRRMWSTCPLEIRSGQTVTGEMREDG
jgi:hypothetical protein